MKSVKAVIVRFVDAALAAAFVGMLATPIAWEEQHEWLGVATFALVVVHIAMRRKALVRLVRMRRATALGMLALDVALVACIVGLAASAIVLSKYAFVWASAASGSSWARTAHLLCSYWGFALVFVHAGVHLRVAVGPLVRVKAAAWAARAAFVVLGALGAWSFVDGGIWSYMTLSTQFVFVDSSEPFGWRLLQCAGMAVFVVGASHYASSLCRARGKTRARRNIRIPRGQR